MENLWKRNFFPLIFTRFSDFGRFLSFQQFFPHPFSTGLFNLVWNFPNFFLRFSLFPTIVAHFSFHSIFLLPRKIFLNFPHSAFSTSLQLFHKVLNTCGKICGKIEKDLWKNLFYKNQADQTYPSGYNLSTLACKNGDLSVRHVAAELSPLPNPLLFQNLSSGKMPRPPARCF